LASELTTGRDDGLPSAPGPYERIAIEAPVAELASVAVVRPDLVLPIDAEALAFVTAIFRNPLLYGDVVKSSNIAGF
jgi:hypothetical protein